MTSQHLVDFMIMSSRPMLKSFYHSPMTLCPLGRLGKFLIRPQRSAATLDLSRDLVMSFPDAGEET